MKRSQNQENAIERKYDQKHTEQQTFEELEEKKMSNVKIALQLLDKIERIDSVFFLFQVKLLEHQIE